MKNLDKLIDTVNYLLNLNGGKLNYTKLIKLLYIADRELLNEFGFTITGDTYYSLHNGPILSKLYNLVKKDAIAPQQAEWDNYFYKEGYDLCGDKLNRPVQELSEIEMEKLEEIDRKYKDYSFGQMIDLVHDPEFCPEWEDPGTSNQRISLQDILVKYGKQDIETANEIVEEYKSLEEENEYLNNCCR